MKTQAGKTITLLRIFQITIGVALVLGSYGCHDNPDAIQALADSVDNGCTVTKSDHLVTIKCGNSDPVTVSDGTNGSDGSNGQDGKNGKDGKNGLGAGISASAIPSGDERCPQGNGGVEYKTFIDVHNTGHLACGDTVTSVNYICNGRDGTNGTDGQNGTNGTDGKDGASSMISLTAAPQEVCPAGGWLFTVTNGPVSSDPVVVCNGATGPQGPAGSDGLPGQTPSGLMITRFIAPCGLASSAWKEQLVELSDGSLLGSFSASASGANTRFTLIPDGSYIDTDESGCTFTVSTSGNTRSVSWGAGSSSAQPGGWDAGSISWTMP